MDESSLKELSLCTLTDYCREIVLATSGGGVSAEVTAVRRDVETLRADVRALQSAMSRDVAAMLAAVSTLLTTSQFSGRAGDAGAPIAVQRPDAAVLTDEVVPGLRTKSRNLRRGALPAAPSVHATDSAAVSGYKHLPGIGTRVQRAWTCRHVRSIHAVRVACVRVSCACVGGA